MQIMSEALSLLPVTVFPCFPEAGKSAVLNHILNNSDGLNVAVSVNDMSEINIIAATVKNDSSFYRSEEKFAEHWREPSDPMRQARVFIGQDPEIQAIIDHSNVCRLNKERILPGKNMCSKLSNPFPSWRH